MADLSDCITVEPNRERHRGCAICRPDYSDGTITHEPSTFVVSFRWPPNGMSVPLCDKHLAMLGDRIANAEDAALSTATMPPGWEARLDVRKREADVADAAVAWRNVEGEDDPNVVLAAVDTLIAKVDALLAARAVAGE